MRASAGPSDAAGGGAVGRSVVPLDAIVADLDKKIVAPSAVLMEASSGRIVWERDADRPRPIASVVKIMTLILVMEALERGDIRLTDVVTASEHVSSMEGPRSGLRWARGCPWRTW